MMSQKKGQKKHQKKGKETAGNKTAFSLQLFVEER